MDYALQVHEAKYIFPIPDGLKELSSDIIREVLRHQPEHINGFIADYLETMLVVREHTRDTSAVVCDVYEEGQFFDELYRRNGTTREQADAYATTIQACWRGYVVRRKLAEWLKKKKKFEEEKERKRTLKIEELLAGMGITYEEATRAAGVIQDAYKESKQSKWSVGEFGENWKTERIPFGQRIREADRAQGRFDKWDKDDFGDFFQMDEIGSIKYCWPKVGQLRKVLRQNLPDDVEIVEFFAMRDLQGREQYSYMIKSQSKMERRGMPIGFLIPVPRALILDSTPEVIFTSPVNVARMGNYSYVFKDVVDRVEIQKFDDLLKANARISADREFFGEFEYDPHWVLPRVLVRIKREHLLDTDDEVAFVSLPSKVVCEEEEYAFRAENLEDTARIVRYILRDECLSVEEGLLKAANLNPYKVKETGRIFPVDDFDHPRCVQKIEIVPEMSSGEDTRDMTAYEYIYVRPHYHGTKKLPPGEPLMKVYMTRFQGYHSDYRGSTSLQDKVFIMGPKMNAVGGKALTFESLFWEEFGEMAWHIFLHDLSREHPEIAGESEIIGEEDNYEEATNYMEKGFDEVTTVKENEKDGEPREGTTTESHEMGSSDASKVHQKDSPLDKSVKSVEGETGKLEIRGEGGEAEKGQEEKQEPTQENKE